MKAFYKVAHFTVYTIFRLVFGLKVIGAERVPSEGRIILAANHISALDPPAVGVSTSRELYFLAKKELFSVPLLGFTIKHLNSIPVDRGASDIRALKTFISILKQDKAVILFPEGTRSRDGQIGSAKEGIGFLAMQTRSDILPVFVRGTTHLKRSLLRKPGMLVKFGNQIHLKDYDDLPLGTRERYKKISEDVLEEIKRLRDEDTD